MDEKIKELALWIIIPVMIAAMLYINAPQKHTVLGAVRCAFITATTAILIGAWIWPDPLLAQSQKYVIILIPSVISDFVFIGFLKMLSAFKEDPFKALSRGFKSFRGK